MNDFITKDNLIQLFLELVPEQAEYVKEQQESFDDAANWMIFSELVSFLGSVYCANPVDETMVDQAERILDFVERGLIQGDSYVLEVMRFGFLEKLEESVPCYEDIKSHLRAISLVNLQMVDDFWAGIAKKKQQH